MEIVPHTLSTTRRLETVTASLDTLSAVENASPRPVLPCLPVLYPSLPVPVQIPTPTWSMDFVYANLATTKLTEPALSAPLALSTTSLFLSVEFPATSTRFTTFSQVFVPVLPLISSFREPVLIAVLMPPTTRLLRLVSVLLATILAAMETVLLAAESTKSTKMVSAVARSDITPSMVSADNAPGTKSMTKVLVSVVFHALVTTSTILASKDASVYPTSGKWLMAPVTPVSFTPPTTLSPNLVHATTDTSTTLAIASHHATPMNSLSMDRVSAEPATTLLVTVVVSVLLLKFMTQFTEFAIFLAKTTKSGTLPFVPADVSLATISSTEFAQRVIPRLNFTINKINAVTAWPVIRRPQVRDVKGNASPFAQSMKITS